MLAPNKPFRSKEPRVHVENQLALGSHRFSLTVIDGDKNESAVAELVITVRKPGLIDRFENIFARPVRDVRNETRDIEKPVRPIRRPPNG